LNQTTVLEDRREAFYLEQLNERGKQYAGFDLLSAQTMLSFLYTYDLLHQVTARYMADYGLSKSSLNILLLLRHGPPEGMQLRELGELLLVSRANITGLIDHLEERGLVNRSVDPGDRRARHARITSKAETLLDEFMPVHCGKVKELMDDLAEDEKAAIVSLLKKARASVRAHSAAWVEGTAMVGNGKG
jgi:MarR family 2-MHQ and catechol resistance regulon transcriptional repressor